MFTIMILSLPFSLASGQEKKSEKKIKIVIDDGSGKKVVVDTVFKNSPGPDSITVKDGTVFYLKPARDYHVRRYHNGKDHETDFEEITVVSSDSLDRKIEEGGNKVYFYSNADSNENNAGTEHRKYRVITHKSGTDGGKEATVYVKKARSSGNVNDKTFDVYVSDDEREGTDEKSRIVIAKDGMVITIEGKDEAKMNAMADDIKAKMGIKNDANPKHETTVNDTNKAIRK